jgi:hypothetical protein
MSLNGRISKTKKDLFIAQNRLEAFLREIPTEREFDGISKESVDANNIRIKTWEILFTLKQTIKDLSEIHDLLLKPVVKSEDQDSELVK